MVELGTSLSGILSGLDRVSRASQEKTNASEDGGGSFADALADALEQYRAVDNAGDEATFALLSGGTEDLSDTLIATEKAELALNLTVAVRNKAVEAYKEIMNMQV
jgi:flagellar hook-basal body complex protein FliE